MSQILSTAKTIVIVGHSPKPKRPSYQIAQYLRRAGYIIYPVNPGHETINGHPCYATLNDIPAPIDIVNVFLRSEHLPEILQSTIAIQAQTIWTQLNITHPDATSIAQTNNINLIMNRCIKIEHQRLIAQH